MLSVHRTKTCQTDSDPTRRLRSRPCISQAALQTI